MANDLPPTEPAPPTYQDDESQELLEEIRSLGAHRILLVVDRGLVQFGKFVLAQVAIFGIIGIFFFGADVKDALKEVRETRDELKELRVELSNAKQRLQTDQDLFRKELTSARNSVESLQEQIAELKQEADIDFLFIQKLRTEAEEHVFIIRQLTVSERDTLARVTETDYKAVTRVKTLADTATDIERQQADTLKLWTNGATLRVRFLDGTKEEQEEVQRIANEWTKFANITFDFVESGDAHIRVTLRPKTSQTLWPAWAYQGTASLGVDQDEATIGLDIANELRMFGFANDNETRGNVLRQFGVALGLIDEIKNPSARIPWDMESLEPYERSLYTPYSESELPGYREFDPESVMFSNVYKSKTKDDFELIRQNHDFSESDKQLIGDLYPPE